jgi:hypothetical protein
MFNKGSALRDQFEQAMEMGKSTAQQPVKATSQILNPFKVVNEIISSPNSLQQGDQGMEAAEQGQSQKPKHTPLDFNKLDDTYKDKEKADMVAVQKRLFDLVKSDEQKAIGSAKKEKQEKLQQEQQEEQKKIQQQKAQQEQDSQSAAPQGKVRHTIGQAHKKAAQDSHQEVKANKAKG